VMNKQLADYQPIPSCWHVSQAKKERKKESLIDQ